MYTTLSIKEPLFRWIQQQTGLHITQVNEEPVLLALKVLASEQHETVDGYAAGLIDGRVYPQPFYDAVTTHESFFLRHRRHMEVAIETVIQPLLRKGVRPRVLSAPCAQGEEPYSFAMLLQDYGIHPGEVEIVATDIAASSIQQAKQGVYRKYSLRQVPDDFIQHHFMYKKNLYHVNSLVQRAVQFVRLNLLEESLARLVPGFHLIFCHNMLIYFDAPTRNQMLEIFCQLLDREGWLFVDTTEVPHVSGVFEGDTVQGVRGFHKRGMKRKSGKLKAPSSKLQATSFMPQISCSEPSVAPAPVINPIEKTASRPKSDVQEKRLSAERAYRNKQFDEAIRLYEQLIEHHPLWACWARVGKARVLIDSGQEMQALEEAGAALSSKEMTAGLHLTKNDEADAHAIIALVLRNKGMQTEMLKHIEVVRKLKPDHEVLRITT